MRSRHALRRLPDRCNAVPGRRVARRRRSRRVVEFIVAAGADGVVFPGVASEFETLARDERTCAGDRGCRRRARTHSARRRRLGRGRQRRGRTCRAGARGWRGRGHGHGARVDARGRAGAGATTTARIAAERRADHPAERAAARRLRLLARSASPRSSRAVPGDRVRQGRNAALRPADHAPARA